jgi:hypothetical protein
VSLNGDGRERQKNGRQKNGIETEENGKKMEGKNNRGQKQ